MSIDKPKKKKKKKISIQAFAKKYFNITLAKHQVRWVEFLENAGPRAILLAPRGHGKTTLINLVYLCWLIAHNPTLNILIVSCSREIAESMALSARDVFERPDIQADFNIKPGSPWRANSWALKSSRASKPTVRVTGPEGKMTGWRGDIVIFDDLFEVTNAATEAQRNKIMRWVYNAVMPAINPSKEERVIVIGTRKHIYDWYGELLKNPDYKHLVDKALDENGKALWPKVWTKKKLLQKKREIGSLEFAQEYMNQPVPISGLTFKYEWLKFYENLPKTNLKYYMGIDPSYGSKEKRSTYFSYAVVAYDKTRDLIYVVDLFRGKLSKQEQIKKSMEVADRYNLETIFVEAVFDYTHVYKALRQTFINVKPIDYVHTKISGTAILNKEERISNILAPIIENGKIMFRSPDLDYYTKTFLQEEYIPFPLGDFDMFDSLTLAVHTLNKRRLIDRVGLYWPGSR